MTAAVGAESLRGLVGPLGSAEPAGITSPVCENLRLSHPVEADSRAAFRGDPSAPLLHYSPPLYLNNGAPPGLAGFFESHRHPPPPRTGVLLRRGPLASLRIRLKRGGTPSAGVGGVHCVHYCGLRPRRLNVASALLYGQKGKGE